MGQAEEGSGVVPLLTDDNNAHGEISQNCGCIFTPDSIKLGIAILSEAKDLSSEVNSSVTLRMTAFMFFLLKTLGYKPNIGVRKSNYAH